MSEIFEWTNDQVISLIKSYKARGMLWDPSHDLYRVQTAKYEAWCELAEMYGCEISDLRKKFNSILASHRREKAKIRMGGRSSWFAYSYLSFLPNHLTYDDYVPSDKDKDEDPEDTAEEEPLEDASEDQSSDLEDDLDNASNSPTNVAVKEETKVTSATPQKEFRSMKSIMQERINKRKLKEEEVRKIKEKRKKKIEENLLKKSKLYKKKDECDSFGEYIAVSLRKHDEKTRSMIKQAINNILFEQEMKKYNSGQYTVIYTEGAVNPLIVPEESEK